MPEFVLAAAVAIKLISTANPPFKTVLPGFVPRIELTTDSLFTALPANTMTNLQPSLSPKLDQRDPSLLWKTLFLATNP